MYDKYTTVMLTEENRSAGYTGTLVICLKLSYKSKTIPKLKNLWDFPGGTLVKNPPANAGDTGSILGLGRSHMARSN